MNKRIKIILMITSILILLGITNVFAVSGDFSVNKSSATIEIGKTTTFTITATNCGGKFSVASSNTSVATVSSSGEWIENGSKEITITAKAAGTTTITITASDVATSDADSVEVTGSKTIAVTVPEKKVETNTNTQEPTNPITLPATTTPEPEPVTKSSEARLSNLGIRPNDFSGFKKDKTEYTTTVPNDVEEVEVYADVIKDSNATVKGTGKVSLKEGDNTVKVTVTAEDGKTTKTYTLTIRRKTVAEEVAENGEARLKSLGIKPEKYDFSGFDSEKTEYSVEIPNEVEEIEIYATAKNSNAQITGTGMITLKEGENDLKIEVIAADGTKKAYTIKVTRKEPGEVTGKTDKVFGLKTLSIEGLKLSPSFKVGTYKYTITLSEDLTELEINAKSNDEDATVEIVGNDNLQEGENVITILVKNEETEENATYQIIVNKNLEREQSVEESVQTSWLKPSTWGKEEIFKVIIIVVLIILIISAIILKINISKENKVSKNVALPGGDELDKAITEHQELAEEPVYTLDKTNNKEQQNYIEEIVKNKFGMDDDFDGKAKRKGRHF